MTPEQIADFAEMKHRCELTISREHTPNIFLLGHWFRQHLAKKWLESYNEFQYICQHPQLALEATEEEIELRKQRLGNVMYYLRLVYLIDWTAYRTKEWSTQARIWTKKQAEK